MSGTNWKKVRLVLLGLGFASGLAVPPFDARAGGVELASWELAILFFLMLLLVLFIPVVLLGIIGLQAINPFSDERWQRPSHRVNPFHLGNPLLFFHFGGYFVLASGAGLVLSALWEGTPAMVHGGLVLLGGAATLAGVWLSMRVFRHKLAE